MYSGHCEIVSFPSTGPAASAVCACVAAAFRLHRRIRRPARQAARPGQARRRASGGLSSPFLLHRYPVLRIEFKQYDLVVAPVNYEFCRRPEYDSENEAEEPSSAERAADGGGKAGAPEDEARSACESRTSPSWPGWRRARSSTTTRTSADLLLDVARGAMERYAADRSAAVREVDGAAARLRLAIHLGVPTGPDDEGSRLLYEIDALTGTSPAFDVLSAAFFDRQVHLYESLIETGAGTGELQPARQRRRRSPVGSSRWRTGLASRSFSDRAASTSRRPRGSCSTTPQRCSAACRCGERLLYGFKELGQPPPPETPSES